jgi:hypothetical protein
MYDRARWSRILAVAGLVLTILGAVDPLEGSVVIVAGTAMAATGAIIGGSRHRPLLLWAFGLTVAGVGLMTGMSVMGGIGGTTGRSMWWALVLLPYPAGWVLGIAGSIRRLRELRRPEGRGGAGPQGPGHDPYSGSGIT